MGVGSIRVLRKILDAVKAAGVVIDDDHQVSIMDVVEEQQPSAKQAKSADVLIQRDGKWHGYNTCVHTTVVALTALLKAKGGGDDPIRGRMILIAGIKGVAPTLAAELIRRGANVILASHEKKAAHEMAQTLQCRFVLFDAIYSTMHDVLIVCDEEKDALKHKQGPTGIHPGYLKSGMVVVDLTADLRRSSLLREAQGRGCSIVTPADLFIDRVDVQSRLFTGKLTPREVLSAALPGWLLEEAEE
jgi:shikimate dehydrogenase